MGNARVVIDVAYKKRYNYINNVFLIIVNIIVWSVNKLLDTIKAEIENIKLMEYCRGDCLLLGMLFLNYIRIGDTGVVPMEKTLLD